MFRQQYCILISKLRKELVLNFKTPKFTKLRECGVIGLNNNTVHLRIIYTSHTNIWVFVCRSDQTGSFYRGPCHAVDVCVSPEGLSGSVRREQPRVKEAAETMSAGACFDLWNHPYQTDYGRKYLTWWQTKDKSIERSRSGHQTSMCSVWSEMWVMFLFSSAHGTEQDLTAATFWLLVSPRRQTFIHTKRVFLMKTHLKISQAGKQRKAIRSRQEGRRRGRRSRRRAGKWSGWRT